MPRGRPRKQPFDEYMDDIRRAAKAPKALVSGKPQGPYTVWVEEAESHWQPRDFDSLQAALEWEGKGSRRFVITKPVQYVVQEIGNAPRVPVKNGAGAEDLSGPPVDPDNPDSGIARYV